MKFRRRPTTVQWVMIGALSAAFVSIAVFVVPEVVGILSSSSEDTFSEWVWDLELPGVIAISLVFAVVAIIAAWASVHFIEGWVARRRRERG